MTKDRRKDLLLQMQRSARFRQGSLSELPVAPGQLPWSETGLLAEGLAFAGRPLKLATGEVTARYDLGPRGAWILNLISNGVAHPTDLSTLFAVGRSLITAELVRLTEAGLIVAKPGTQDRRRSELALTPQGEAACQAIRAAVSTIIYGNLRDFSIEEIRLFTRMLRAVRGDEDSGGGDEV